jgi:hypothetical protein
MITQFEADEQTVLVLLERVTEAERVAIKQLKEMQSTDGSMRGKKRGRNEEVEDGENAEAIVRNAIKKRSTGPKKNPRRH